MSISFSYLTTHCNLFSSLIMNVVMVAVVPEPASMYFEREGECEHARDCGGGDGGGGDGDCGGGDRGGGDCGREGGEGREGEGEGGTALPER